jgi:hypothetical protein
MVPEADPLAWFPSGYPVSTYATATGYMLEWEKRRPFGVPRNGQTESIAEMLKHIEVGEWEEGEG